MADRTLKPPTPQTLALMAAAAGASPPLPDDAAERAAWFESIELTAIELYRRAQRVQQTADAIDGSRVVTGVIESVVDHAPSNRAVITIKATMGNRQGKAEKLRTPFLRDPAGAALAAQARSLIGQHCQFGKFNEQAEIDGEEGRETVKVGMVAWLEPIPHPGQPREIARDRAQTPAAGPRQSRDPVATERDTSRDTPRDRNGPETANPQVSEGGGRDTSPDRSRDPVATDRDSAPQNRESPAAGPRDIPRDRAVFDRRTLFAVSPKTWDQLVDAASEYFGWSTAQVMELGMGEYGAAGPTKQPHFAKLWRQLVERHAPKAA